MESCSELVSFIGNMSATYTFSSLDYRITQKEIKSCMLKLKHGKAVGMDRISAEMIKHLLNNCFLYMINYSFLYLGKGLPNQPVREFYCTIF